MIYISHRGYTNGSNEDLENNPDQIKYLLSKNIHVEIDLRFFKHKLYLGHDEPRYQVDKSFLSNDKLWCHAKDAESLSELTKMNCHYFWHQKDDYTITSKGFIWVYPGKSLIKNSICVIPEKFKQDYSMCYGVCSDYLDKIIKI